MKEWAVNSGMYLAMTAFGHEQPVKSMGLFMPELLFYRLCLVNEYVPGVLRGNGFYQGNPAFFFRHRVVHGSLRHNVEVAFIQNYAVVLIFDDQSALEYVEQLIFFIMFVPRKRTAKFRNLYELIIHSSNDSWRPVVIYEFEFLQKIDCIHCIDFRATNGLLWVFDDP